MAFVQNSYLYHTRKDTLDMLQPGSLQHMGDNTLAMLSYLASTPDALSDIKPSRSTVFFSVFGPHVFVVCSYTTAISVYGALLAVISAILFQAVSQAGLRIYALALCGQLCGLVGALLSVNMSAFLVATVLDKSLTWYRKWIAAHPKTAS
jgi:hypothetical protein